MADCIFCKISSGELQAEIVWQDEKALAFRDIKPQAPKHLLLIPKRHIASLREASPEDESLLGHLLAAIPKVAQQEGIGGNFRVVFNNGAEAGQSVFHIHAHILGGRAFRWPPG